VSFRFLILDFGFEPWAIPGGGSRFRLNTAQPCITTLLNPRDQHSMLNPRDQHSKRNTRKSKVAPAGFTLLEVLIAMAVSLLLLGAVYSALDLHWKYSTAGRDEVERAQLVRAIFQRMELDIRSVVYPPPTASDASQMAAGGSSTGSTAGSATGPAAGASGAGTAGTASTASTAGTASTADGSTTTTPADSTEAITQTTVGVIGDSQTLMLHVSRPSRHLEYATLFDEQSVAARSSDLLSVAYFVATSGGSGLQGLVGSRLGGGATGTARGLARLEGDRLMMNLADEQGNLDALASQTELLAPEVTAVQFLYYDGAEWLTDWDSTALGGLPRAIRVEMLVQQQVYSLVIAVPLAKPTTSSTTSTY
jgi:prepilin-type N-terminal cleavage/methylation domain-containing protein